MLLLNMGPFHRPNYVVVDEVPRILSPTNKGNIVAVVSGPPYISVHTQSVEAVQGVLVILLTLKPIGEVELFLKGHPAVDLAEQIRILASIQIHHEIVRSPMYVRFPHAAELLALFALPLSNSLQTHVRVDEMLNACGARGTLRSLVATNPAIAAKPARSRLALFSASPQLLLRHAQCDIHTQAVLDTI